MSANLCGLGSRTPSIPAGVPSVMRRACGAAGGLGLKRPAMITANPLRYLVRPEREPLGPFVQLDEALAGGKDGAHKKLVLVAAEADGRVCLADAETNDTATLKPFADGQGCGGTRGS